MPPNERTFLKGQIGHGQTRSVAQRSTLAAPGGPRCERSRAPVAQQRSTAFGPQKSVHSILPSSTRFGNSGHSGTNSGNYIKMSRNSVKIPETFTERGINTNSGFGFRLRKPTLVSSETKTSFNPRNKTQIPKIKSVVKKSGPPSQRPGSIANVPFRDVYDNSTKINLSSYRGFNSSKGFLVGTTINKSDLIGGGGDSNDKNMLAPSSEMNKNITDLSLGEQKRLQWAKEREELNGLWSPWGRAGETKSMSAIYGSQPSNAVPSSYVTKLGLQSNTAANYSQSDVYLPPIKSGLALAQQSHSHQHQKSTTWAIKNSKDENYNNNNKNSENNVLVSRKSSLPNFSHGDGYHTNAHLSHSYHNELDKHGGFFANKSNGWSSTDEPEVVLNGYHTSGYQSENNNDFQHLHQQELRKGSMEAPRTEGFQWATASNSGVRSPRVILHQILMDPSSNNARAEAEYLMSNSMIGSSSHNSNSYSNLEEMKRSYGGSTGYLTATTNPNLKPPPVAMRSSLTIGLDSPFANSFKDIEKKEKEQWLNELEKQREEQRLRKIEDKRARWGDRGIGVGHFWEPGDSLNARLPRTPNSRDGQSGGGGDSSPTPPAWLERSLNNMQSSKSQPNLLQEQNSSNNNSSGNFNLFVNQNQSSMDLRNAPGLSPDSGDRTFIRGQNVPIDPDLMAEKEKKRQANNDHLEAIKQQIAERQRKLKEEKEREMQEDRDQEQRIAYQRELELKRLDMEKRKRSSQNDQDCETSSNGIEIHESGGKPPTGFFASRRNQDSEPPLIPHQEVHEQPDAYEMEIARRQSVLLSTTTTDQEEGIRIGSGSLTDLRRDESSSGKGFKSIHIDQCLMTDSDHLYERTLTPTKERSHSLGRQREFGTQTEQSDTGLTSDANYKSSAKSQSHNSLSDAKSKSKDYKKKAEEKPRWGSNPVKKQYLKQSEKDPNYQQRMRRRQGRQQQMNSGGFETGTDESDDLNGHFNNNNSNVPFPRIRNRIKSKSPVKKQNQGHQVQGQAPLKALHAKSESKQTNGSRSKEAGQRSTLQKNFKSESHLNNNKSKHQNSSKTNNMNGIVRRNLGSIGGLNSAGGTTEESQSGSGFTSPSLFQRNINSGISGASEITTSLSSSQSHNQPQSPEMPEYIPSFSSDFVLQKDFDELPINAGKIAPGFHKTFGGGRNSPAFEMAKLETISKPKIESRVKSKTVVKSKAKTQKVARNQNSAMESSFKRESRQEERRDEQVILPPPTLQRVSSPPVPALLKKLQMGFHTDETGRLSSLGPEITSPIPTLAIGSRLTTPMPSRMSSASPKIDIDIAVTSTSNPDLQRILEEAESQASLSQQERESRRESTDTESSEKNNYKEPLKLPYIAPEIISSRSNRSLISRPTTVGSEASLQIEEDFLMEVMGRREVQEQLSARASELSQKGIIEFNVRVPASWTNSAKRRQQLEYRDPLISERRKSTADWLRRMDDRPKEAILTNLSSLKQGIRMQQVELDLNQIRPMAYALTTDEE